jgi:hypothetical protein
LFGSLPSSFVLFVGPFLVQIVDLGIEWLVLLFLFFLVIGPLSLLVPIQLPADARDSPRLKDFETFYPEMRTWLHWAYDGSGGESVDESGGESIFQQNNRAEPTDRNERRRRPS